MSQPPIDLEHAQSLAQRIAEVASGTPIQLGVSWLDGAEAEPGEIAVPHAATKELLLYRNRANPWPGFFVTGYQDDQEVVVHARDTGFDASRVFLFFNSLMKHLEARRFLPEARTYPGHVLYVVRYIR